MHWVEGNLRPRRPPREYLGEYTSRGKPKIPPADRILMDPGHKARKNPSDNADLGFQAVGPALRIMQLNVEGLSAATHTRRRSRMHCCHNSSSIINSNNNGNININTRTSVHRIRTRPNFRPYLAPVKTS